MDYLDAIGEFLEAFGFQKTLAVFRKEAAGKENVDPTGTPHAGLAKLLRKEILRERDRVVGKPAPSPVQTPNPEAEVVMEKFMNRLVDTKRLEKTAAMKSQISSLKNVKAFQKIISCADQLFFGDEHEPTSVTATENLLDESE
jgi:hypothetical protein